MNIWYSFIVTILSLFIIILFPYREYIDYAMFGYIVFLISVNRYELHKISKKLKDKNEDINNKHR
jgi:hypothetical protein